MGGKGGRFWLILVDLGGSWGTLGVQKHFQDRFLKKEKGTVCEKRPQDAPRGVKRRPKGPPKLPK